VEGLLAVEIQVVQALAGIPVALLGDVDRQDRIARLVQRVHRLVARYDRDLVFD
jgi:hypothetical protein